MLRAESLRERLLVSGQWSDTGRAGEEVRDGTKEEKGLGREGLVATSQTGGVL